MLLPSVVVVVCVERLKSSYIVLYYLACLVGRLSWSVVSVALACLLLSLVVATVIRDVPTVATAWPPWVPSGGPTGDHQEGGGIFQKGGRG